MDKLEPRPYATDAENTVVSSEDPLSPVAPEHKQPAFGLLITAFCWGFLATGMIVGGSLVTRTDVATFTWLTAVGNGTSLLIGCAVGYVGYATSLNSGLLFQLTYGRLGAWLPVGMIVAMATGWHAIVAGAIGYTWSNSDSGPSYVIAASAAGLLITAATYFGIKSIERVSMPAAVALLIAGIYSLWAQVGSIGGLDAFLAEASLVEGDPIDRAEGLNLVIGSWIVGAVVMAEYTRFAKRLWVALAFPFVALMLAQWLMQILGAVSTTVSGSYDFTVFMKDQGPLLGGLGILAMTLALWTSGNANLYFPVIQSSVVLRRSPKSLTIVLGLIGTCLAFGVYQYFETFLNMLANIVPPLVGPVLARFYLCARFDVDTFADKTSVEPVWVGIASYAAGALSTLVSPEFMIPSLFGLVVSVLLYWLLVKLRSLVGPSRNAKEGEASAS
jgi:cytosine permease